MACIYVIFVFIILSCATTGQENANFDISSCSLSCGQRHPSGNLVTHQGIQGKRGIKGEKGVIGSKGRKGEDCECFLQDREEVDEIREQINTLQSAACPQTAYLFPQSNQKTDFIRFKYPIPPLTEATICMWAESYGTGIFTGTLISYSTPQHSNNLVLLYNPGGRVYSMIRDDDKSSQHPLTKGKEHHVCMVINRGGGQAKLYYNGTESQTYRYSNRNPIPSGGAFLIGQEQDSYLGTFDATQSFHGVISNFMIWDRQLSSTEIRAMTENKCHCAKNYIAALTSDQVQLEGGVNALHANQCG